MPLVQVGITAARTPHGDFLPSTPIYAEVERLSHAGFAPQEEKTIKELSQLFADKFKDYIDGCKAAERERRGGQNERV